MIKNLHKSSIESNNSKILGIDKNSFAMIRDEKEEMFGSPEYKFKIKSKEEEKNYNAYLKQE